MEENVGRDILGVLVCIRQNIPFSAADVGIKKLKIFANFLNFP